MVPRLPGSCNAGEHDDKGGCFAMSVEQVRPGPVGRLDERGDGLGRFGGQGGAERFRHT